ncbi:MAG: VOC family protein [Gammaproteobacteria bacterium]|jgi:catechol 2,3-dioxygenase-like lactoylglutathione lyase family enzyme|nr:VOC family protein [Gammaproteobacteria bacterium]
MHVRHLLITFLSILTIVSSTADAAPVAEAGRVPIDLRRTTLIVRDMDTSLRFYRDTLGLRVAYDQVIRTPRDAPDDESAQRSLRLVFLQANDDFIGMIGLIQYYKPFKTPARAPEPFSIGSMVFVFNTSDVERRFEAARRLPGVRVVDEPTKTTYPGYGGEGVIPVIVSTLTDPDGYTVELNELLVEQPQRKRPES